MHLKHIQNSKYSFIEVIKSFFVLKKRCRQTSGTGLAVGPQSRRTTAVKLQYAASAKISRRQTCVAE